MIQHFHKNISGYDYIVGDIHGCFSKLQATLDELGFNEEADRLFSVGDLIDRGPESEECLDWLAKPWFHAVRGNHEDMAIRVVEGTWPAYNYLQNGGAWFLQMDKSRQQLFADEFRFLPIAIQVETDEGLIGIVHAECPLNNWQDFGVALTEHNKDSYVQMAIWNRDRFNSGNDTPITGVHKVYVGHTPVPEPLVSGNVHYIDTGAVFGRELTVVKI